MNEPLKSKPPTEEDLFYLKWGEETIKKNIENAHSTLTQFLTLNTALMGGSIVFMEPENINNAWLSLSLVFFFIALCISFLGILPHESRVNPISPSQIKEHKNRALIIKRRFMWACAISTGGGLLILSIGALITQ